LHLERPVHGIRGQGQRQLLDAASQRFAHAAAARGAGRAGAPAAAAARTGAPAHTGRAGGRAEDRTRTATAVLPAVADTAGARLVFLASPIRARHAGRESPLDPP